MQGTRTIMQAGCLTEEGISVTVASTVDDGSGPVADLWFTTPESDERNMVSLEPGEWCMLGATHRMAAREVVASTRDRRGAVILEIEEVDDTDA